MTPAPVSETKLSTVPGQGHEPPLARHPEELKMMWSKADSDSRQRPGGAGADDLRVLEQADHCSVAEATRSSSLAEALAALGVSR